MSERIKVLITVKTYPTPSQKHFETVCTAGVREDGSFVRLYPIPYRYHDQMEQFEKYQWIEVDVIPSDSDPRPESYKPLMGSLQVISKPLSTKDYWAQRKAIVLKQAKQTMCELNETHVSECSLGIIKAIDVSNFKVLPGDKDWVGKAKAATMQIPLEGKLKELEKIPYKFKYKYRCESPKCKGHEQLITDWEVGQLYRRMRDKYGEQEAIEKVKYKFFNEICGTSKDTYFYVGRVNVHWTWIILGCFYPKCEPIRQLSLF